jgi:hypothetical protein
MNGHHPLSAVSPSCTTKWWHLIKYSQQCKLHICLYAHKKDPPCTLGDWAHWATGEDSWQYFFHKLLAICFLEADFNWINKVVFAKQMIGSALERDFIPGKCFSKKGSTCINAVMTNIFICNESRIHHHDACIAGNDFGDCSDWAAYPIAAISLQSLRVP